MSNPVLESRGIKAIANALKQVEAGGGTVTGVLETPSGYEIQYTKPREGDIKDLAPALKQLSAEGKTVTGALWTPQGWQISYQEPAARPAWINKYTGELMGPKSIVWYAMLGKQTAIPQGTAITDVVQGAEGIEIKYTTPVPKPVYEPKVIPATTERELTTVAYGPARTETPEQLLAETQWMKLGLQGLTPEQREIYLKSPQYQADITGTASPGAAIAIGEYDLMVLASVTMPFIAPVTLPALGLSAGKIALAGIAGLAFSEGISLVTTRKPLEIEQIPPALMLGEGMSIVSAGTFMGIGKLAPSIVQSLAGRTAISAGIGGATSGILSGGNPEEIIKGAAFGAVISLGTELIAQPLWNELKPKLGLVQRVTAGPPTTGKAGELQETWVSEPLEELGGKSLRIVSGVTERPIELSDIDDLINEYVGKNVPTAHATLSPSEFDLSAGGETLLKGFPEQGAGWRSLEELYHFYSAPGSEEFVNVYGGYIGVGEGYESGLAPRIVFGGKSTALVTLDTEISPTFLQQTGESTSEWLSRISFASGKTGIAPETLLGKSVERQLITPTNYTRFGEELPGSLFVSEGKVGTFQIKQLPSGTLGKIPILRTMFAKYTNVDVFLGSYKPVEGFISPARTINVSAYAQETLRSINVSVPSILASPTLLYATASIAPTTKLMPTASVFKTTIPSVEKMMVTLGVTTTYHTTVAPSVMQTQSKTITPSTSIFKASLPAMTQPTSRIVSNVESMLKSTFTIPKSISSESIVSKTILSPSIISRNIISPSTSTITQPSYPSFPSQPSTPSPSIPSLPSMPSIPILSLSASKSSTVTAILNQMMAKKKFKAKAQIPLWMRKMQPIAGPREAKKLLKKFGI